MKVSACIFNGIFVLVLSLLHIQPLWIEKEIEEEKTCAKSKCQEQNPCEEKDDCKNKGCNPFTPCSMGSCCYLVENFFSPATIPAGKKQKIAIFNDNRLLNKLSDCWHPPETLS